MKPLLSLSLTVSAVLIGTPIQAAAQATASGTEAATSEKTTSQTPTLPPPTSITQPPAPDVPNVYRINPGDELEVYVWGEERLQRTVRVLPDGTMSFPLVGQIVAQHRQLSELEATISSRLAGQYRGQVPQVTVSVKTPSGMQFSVMGKIKSPGTFTPGRYVNILEALSLAGGPDEFANLDNVLVIHNTASGVRTERLRLASIFRSGTSAGVDSAMVKRIEPGDTVIVP